jgi:hypothetical protein
VLWKFAKLRVIEITLESVLKYKDKAFEKANNNLTFPSIFKENYAQN